MNTHLITKGLLAAALFASTWSGITNLKASPVPGPAPYSPYTDPHFTSWMVNTKGTAATVRLTDSGRATNRWNSLIDSTGVWVSSIWSDVSAAGYDPAGSFAYISCSGLASYTMGPWHGGKVPSGYFEFRPIDRVTASGLAGSSVSPYIGIPLKPIVAGVGACPVGLGQIGVWVNGTSVYGPSAGITYSNLNYWTYDANRTESDTFDIAGFHQDAPGVPTEGQHHAHISPDGLRWQLNDNIIAITEGDKIVRYEPLATTPIHSRILGWAHDGYPIYGPYGYTVATDPGKGVSLMRSGYVVRDGKYGTDNLNVGGKQRMPIWVSLLAGDPRPHFIAAKYARPSTTVESLGSFLEDYEYRGDVAGGGVIGADWDLDHCNGRFCITPEYPKGTYAYFVTETIGGGVRTPQFPYIIGPMYNGVPNGGEVTSVPATIPVFP